MTLRVVAAIPKQTVDAIDPHMLFAAGLGVLRVQPIHKLLDGLALRSEYGCLPLNSDCYIC